MTYSYLRATTIGILLLGLVAPSLALSPWFSSSFQYVHHALQRFTYCHNLEPIVTSNMNASEYLVQQINNFFDVASYDAENLNATIRLFGLMCISDEVKYEIIGDIDPVKFGEQKTLRCSTLDEVMNKIYPELKRSAINGSIILNFENIDYQRIKNNGTDVAFYKNLVSFINTAWIQSKFEKERLCDITNNVTSHLINLREQQKNSNSTKRVGQEKPATNQGLIGTINYYLDPLLAFYTRIYLGLTTEAGQARMAVSSGYHATTNFFRNLISFSPKKPISAV